MINVRIGAAARRDLQEIRRHGIREHGEPASARYLLGFDRIFALLRDQPFVGRERAELGNEARSLSHRPHVILYRVVGDNVIIDRIIHQARDVGRALRDDH